MKKIGLYLAIVSWGWLVLYAAGSFVAASFNVTTWVVEGRFLISLLASGIAALAAITAFM